MFSCVLNHQLPFQTYLAAYFVTTDLILIFQFFRYRNNTPEEEIFIKIPDQSCDDEESMFLTRNQTLEMTSTMDSSILNNYGSTQKTKSTMSLMALLLFGYKSSLSSGTDSVEMLSYQVTFGWVLAWFCTSFYILSRIPQIYKNFKRQSTQGLSIALFMFAVVGNITYALSILFHPGHTTETLLESLPYVYGSFGTLFFDAVIFGQFLHYRKKNTTNDIHTTTSIARILTFE